MRTVITGLITAHITSHFTWAEAACHDGTAVPAELRPNAVALATMLERLRARLGGALVPVSWYRSPAYNARVRGAMASQHMAGGAADIRPANLADLHGLILCIETMLRDGSLPELGGWGVYPAWVHVDIRTRPAGGHIAFWRGAGVGSEAA